MSPGQRRYLLSETAISAAVNSAISILAFWLTFRDAGSVPVSPWALVGTTVSRKNV